MLHLGNEVESTHNASAINLIKETMKYHHVTQMDLSERIGVSQKYISNLLNRKVFMNETIADRIETVMGLSAKLLLAMDNDYKLHHNIKIKNKPDTNYLQRYTWVK